ncbi:MAG: AmmeMemoRadiSam system protein B [archaeon]
MRQPVVAGSFYEADPMQLRIQIETCYLSEFGPGKLPGKLSNQKIKGVIVPHAGYFFSGACAAHAYKKIAESNISKFIILGVNHYGFETGISSQDWNTPLGKAKYDKEMVDYFKKSGLKVSETPHLKEHSIEVQLPFLQYSKKEFTFAAIGIGHDADLDNLAKILSQIKDAIIIVSSDFTHYGFNYGYIPFSANIKNNLEKLDMEAIGSIKNCDYEGFRKFVNKTGITICGFLPILTFLKTIEKGQGKLMKYYTSGDVLNDFRNSVSYASILF